MGPAPQGQLSGPGDVVVPVQLLSPQAVVPQRAYEHDAAYDLCAAEALVLAPQARAVVGTGVALGLPPGLAALTLPRSGLAARHGLTIINAPGLIDPGYRGELRIILLNTDKEQSFPIAVGDRIAQLLFLPLTAVTLAAVTQLDETERGERGFGSSGRAGQPGGEAQ
jgi:dUTP pyrophosphatase